MLEQANSFRKHLDVGSRTPLTDVLLIKAQFSMKTAAQTWKKGTPSRGMRLSSCSRAEVSLVEPQTGICYRVSNWAERKKGRLLVTVPFCQETPLGDLFVRISSVFERLCISYWLRDNCVFS